MQTIQAKNLTRYEVEKKFGLQLVQDEEFFQEWLNDLPEITDGEKQRLDRVKSQYMHLSARPMLESMVRMVVVSPLLDLAGFFDPPFFVTAEEEVRIFDDADGDTIQGRIDVLVLQGNFWVAVVESKREKIDVMQALPQALIYMMANPYPEKSAFGVLINGREVIFVKLTQQDTPKYALSDVFSVVNRGNELYGVVRVLKRLGQAIGQ